MSTLRRAVAAATLVTYGTACHSWRPLAPAPELVIAEQQFDRVRVTTRQGERFELAEPTVRADSLFGLREAVGVRSMRRFLAGVALADVARIETLHSDAGRTVLAVVLVSGGLFALGMIGCAASDKCLPFTKSGN
ncbi:MAG: hypothetical protein OER21_15725 [Gemmatimonadota bacterium]|nr:hypothetical protein [Gemmatimonadota bacterium]